METWVAEDMDGSSYWRLETIPAESCVVGEVGGSSWPVAEDALKYFRSAPEIAIEIDIKRP